MKLSYPVYGSSRMSNLEYWRIGILQGWAEFRYTFATWYDLMTNNYEDYFSFNEDDESEVCRLTFWDGLNEQAYEKEFLEQLYQVSEDIRSGKVKVIPVGENFFASEEAFESLMNIFKEDSLDE